ncbi:PREDICTED: prostate and testis expressed protein 3 [Miniopterus natalensis]|uniref:prostate and testis expressed protein 3 n=1 Tax=Miniopterus natalensis TaxID=291302 RepID=UPI0007A6CBB5|nr:PREDICTED: prostate and testis expressed protein 3 [Miniopterus natalensis]
MGKKFHEQSRKRFLEIFVIHSVTPLKCITCHLLMVPDRCRNGFGICYAEKYESCMRLNILKDSELRLSYLVCQKHCRDLTLEFNHRTYVHQCCTTDFCNVSI